MSDLTAQPQFLKFLEAGVSRGGFEPHDILAALLPLLRQVKSVHESGLVAPLDGLRDLVINDEAELTFPPDKAIPPQKNASKIEAIQRSVSGAVEVVAEVRRTTDLDHGSLTVS